MNNTTLALSVFNNIKNLNNVEFHNNPSNETIRLILNHIPRRDYETLDHLYEMIDDQLEFAIEDFIEVKDKWKNSPELNAAKLRKEFWERVYEVFTINNGVAA